MHRKISLWTTLVVCFLLASPALAQMGLGVANRYTISSPDIKGGEIISYKDSQYVLSQEAYDKRLFGVVSLEPAIELGFEGQENSFPVITTGATLVTVNGQSGPIAVGDRITSSGAQGIGMKATKTGFILGTAQEAFNPASPEDTGKIRVSLEIKLAFGEDTPASEKIASRLSDVLKLSSLASIEDPVQTMRYVLAAIVLVGTMVISFFTFMRLGYKGIEAAGRNPLASRVILTSIGLNVLASGFILTVGIVGSYILVTYK